MQKALFGLRGVVCAQTRRALTSDCKVREDFRGVMFGLWGVVAKPSFSKHEEAWEKQKQIPVGTFRSFSQMEGGAIQRVLDGEIGTTEGGARLLSEFYEEGVIGCETLTPMDLTWQIRNILETARLNPEIQDALHCLRHNGLSTGLMCHQWAQPGKSISTPEQLIAKAAVERNFSTIVESKQVKLHRDDPAFYRLAARRLNLAPEDLIYVDSRQRHLVPAAVAGCKTVNFVCPETAVKELEQHLQMDLRRNDSSQRPAAATTRPQITPDRQRDRGSNHSGPSSKFVYA